MKYDFCDAALVLGQEAAALPSAELVTFAARALPQLEGVFDRFYASYESYQTDLQKWIALYGSPEMRAAQAGQANMMVQPTGAPTTAPAAPSSQPPVLPTVLSNSGT